jgi:hypothetical protein
MKVNKSKLSEKTDAKTAQKVVKKELEVSITHKFLDALKGLGYDAEKFSKEVKKSSKVLAKKISKKYSEVKIAVEEKLVKKPATVKIKTIKSPIVAKAKAAKAPAKKAPATKIVKEKKVVIAKSTLKERMQSGGIKVIKPNARVAKDENKASVGKPKASPVKNAVTVKSAPKAKKAAPTKAPKI